MTNQNGLKKFWLLTLVVLIMLMIGVGGATRLTRSGLSIVEWRPVAGIVPPMSDQDWEAQFQLYKASPEFQQVNANFSVADYKKIFIWEYLHRLLGRIIFLVALIPGIILWRKKIVSGKLVTALCALVAAQGLIGWLMVKSGLQHEPQVSPWMLALHFFSAITVLLTAYYQLVKARVSFAYANTDRFAIKLFRVIGIMLAVQIIYGCLTAGMRAGFAFNTFPLMADQVFPPGGLMFQPWWSNWWRNPATIQFMHRWFGILTFGLVIAMIVLAKRSPQLKAAKGPLFHLMGVMLLQIILGVLNLVLVVPISLAVAHQIVATLIVMAYFNFRWRVYSTDQRVSERN